ncbi:MAG: Ribonuclease Y [Candidatus Uhrbacteria bacterium GW2011_GWF2_41_16]|uniref:Ribonuclease Y n=2 Tax=Candidatus Uhriibacteriota TaxID=1752732 RepID=A0A0G0YEE8_9BACT|nr:MAG: Ribonuclease Y [Candidatus Uhrbacteria bacterium GW2011_GWA2_41_10]KKR87748.1 MAG: Ribonuclease Y [Candidatus Uhrbacteria bacterium GW2011_GWC2_41_11]KKR98687.1 MAG: Ribonuclease Y [Candidatus Uhrbacteria bacterium GW2011_GWF2_41_16]
MLSLPFTIFILGCGLIAGACIGYIMRRYLAQKTMRNAETKAEKLIAESKTKQQELLIEAKEKAINIIEEAKREETNRQRDLQESQKRLEKREVLFDQKLLELEDKKNKLEEKVKHVEEGKKKVLELREQAVEKLQEISNLTKTQAEERLLKLVEETHQEAMLNRIRKLEQMTEEELERQARKLLSLAVTRYASSQAIETTTTAVTLPSDEMKGRIIGKEGRNIKAIELLTGTEIIVDDTPEIITISGFSPIRRQVAKLALEMLIKDGRIHPARIEESISDAKKMLATDIKKSGEEALYTLGIPVSSIDPKLVSILGRLKYRTSYGQNVLQHSIEVAQLSAIMGEELGADVFVCKKGGLFHDIGKAVDHDMQGAHPEIGYNILKKFGLPEEICYQSIAHHEDRPRTIEGALVKAADAISGARPGARKQSLEQFVGRMKELEQTAISFEGVEKAYAIQAGREVRVFVQPEKIDDLTAYKLAKDIALKIEGELQYPGEVKITLIRETRVVEYAR